jgi:hypothetical protein
MIVWFGKKMMKSFLSQHSTRLWNWDTELHPEGEAKLTDSETFDPRYIFWQPHTNQLLVSRDHERFNIWSVDINRDSSEVEWRLQTSDQCIFSDGWINNVFFSPKYTLIDSEHKYCVGPPLIHHTLLIDEFGDTVVHLRRSHDNISPFGLLYLNGIFLDRSSNPFRPGSTSELLVIDNTSPHLFTVTVDALKNADENYMEKNSQESLKKLSVDQIDLVPIKNDGDDIRNFAWHPSGNYIAVEINYIVYVIHWQSANIVTAIENTEGEGYFLEEWSPDGSLLKLKTTVDDDRGRVVWDCDTGDILQLNRDEHWPSSLVLKQDVDYKLVNKCGYGYYRPFGPWRNAAWWPSDPRYCASVGGDGAQRMIRVWCNLKKVQ